MKKMTKKEALSTVYQTIRAFEGEIIGEYNDEQIDKLNSALDIIENMYADLNSTSSDEAKAERRAKNAEKRNQEIAPIIPVVLEALIEKPNQTASELYESIKGNIPADWSVAKVQYLLLHEVADRVGKNEVKGKPNTYFFIEK